MLVVRDDPSFDPILFVFSQGLLNPGDVCRVLDNEFPKFGDRVEGSHGSTLAFPIVKTFPTTRKKTHFTHVNGFRVIFILGTGVEVEEDAN